MTIVIVVLLESVFGIRNHQRVPRTKYWGTNTNTSRHWSRLSRAEKQYKLKENNHRKTKTKPEKMVGGG